MAENKVIEKKENIDDLFVMYKVDDSVSEVIAAPQYSYWKSVFRRFFSSKVAILMLVVLFSVIAMSIIHPIISGYDHMSMDNVLDSSQWFLRPSAEHWFGTDDVGRDMFSLVWSGARTSLFISFSASIISMFIGLVVGLFWGFSKKVDIVMIEVYNILANIPALLIIMVLSFALGAGLWQLMFAFVFTSWLSMAYFIRVQVMIIRDREYNLASRCLGSSTAKIIRNNIFPYLISVLVTVLSRDIPAFISYEVFLGYIGIGLGEQYASLGRVVQQSAKHMQSASYLFVIPLIITAMISVSLFIVGQTLADASDPRTHML